MQNFESYGRATGAYMPGITQNHAACQRLVKKIYMRAVSISRENVFISRHEARIIK